MNRNLKLFSDPFFLDFLDLVNETPNFVSRTVKRTNVKEDEDQYIVELAVPGISKEDMEIKVKESILTISYENKDEDIDFSFTNSFDKQYTLPDDVIVKSITATVESGVLVVTIPKDKKKPKEQIIKIV